jgi:predicted RNA-binding protein with PUA domain
LPTVGQPQRDRPKLMSPRCANCETPLVGEYCHACGQRCLVRLTVHAFAADVVRRVFRFDKAVVHTFWQMLHSPGVLVSNYSRSSSS